jgi:hypothetical protein
MIADAALPFVATRRIRLGRVKQPGECRKLDHRLFPNRFHTITRCKRRPLDSAAERRADWVEMLCQPVAIRLTADSVAASHSTGIELLVIIPR